MQPVMLSLRKIIHARFPKSKEPSINKMPPELLYMIFPLLDVPDQICFALTCKRLLACFEIFLKPSNKRLSQLAPFPQWRTLCRGFSIAPRTQLLAQLKSERWEYCSGCWTLHPRTPKTARRAWEFCKKIRHQKRRANNHVLARRDCTTRANSEVDICPHLTLAFGDRLLPKQDIKAATRFFFDQRTRSYDHKCSFSGNPLAKIYIRTKVFIGDTGSVSRVANQHTFEGEPNLDNEQAWHWAEENFKFDDYSTSTWLRMFFEQAGSSFRGWVDNPPVYIGGGFSCASSKDAVLPFYVGFSLTWQSDTPDTD